MQIHELNNRKPINEVDLVGPNSVFNVGKQVLKNPAALYKSSALGAAQAAAQGAHAQTSADKLAAQGYTTSSVKPAVSTAQQLQAVNANPAVQQQVKNLTSQWMTQSQSLKKATPVSEATAQFDPRDLTDPKYASILRAMQAQGGAPTSPTQDQTAASNVELEKKLSNWKAQFKTWSDPKLQVSGITVDKVRQDPATAKMLDSAIADVAVAAQAGDASIEKQAVAQYFNIAIAAIQAFAQNTNQYQPQSVSAGRTGSAAAQNQDEITKVRQQLQQIGLGDAQLSSLGKLMSDAARGGNTVRNTGNPVLNAIAQLAGMKIQ